MNLDRANWNLDPARDLHVAWYHESLRLIDAFTYQTNAYDNNVREFKEGTNLCHYVRVCGWGVVVLLAQLFMVVLVAHALVIKPLQVFGFFGAITYYSWIFGICAVVAGIGYVLYLLDEHSVGRSFARWLERWVVEPTHAAGRKAGNAVSFRNEDGVSFWTLVWTMIVTLKHKICPLITIGAADEAVEAE